MGKTADKGRINLETTEESIGETLRMISGSQFEVLRLVYFPTIHRDKGVQEALEKAISQKTVEIICPSEFPGYIFDEAVGGYITLTEADKELLSKAKTIAVRPIADGSSCTTDLPFTLETIAESYYIEGKAVRIHPDFLRRAPSGGSFIWYTIHEREGNISIQSVLYSAEYTAKQVKAYREELKSWLEENLARPYLRT